MFIVYKVTSPSNKVYIGITSQSLEKRKNKHFNCANKNRRNGKFQKAILKYKNSLLWEILEIVETKQLAVDKEKYYIKFYNSFDKGYNCTLGGEFNFGWIPSKITKTKMSKAAKGKKFTKQHRKSLSNAQKLHKKSKDVRILMAKQRGAKEFLVFDKNNKFVTEYICRNLCAKELNLDRSLILKVLKKQRSHTGGYKFIYKDEYYGKTVK